MQYGHKIMPYIQPVPKISSEAPQIAKVPNFHSDKDACFRKQVDTPLAATKRTSIHSRSPEFRPRCVYCLCSFFKCCVYIVLAPL